MNRLLVWGYFSRKPWAAIQTEEGFLFHECYSTSKGFDPEKFHRAVIEPGPKDLVIQKAQIQSKELALNTYGKYYADALPIITFSTADGKTHRFAVDKKYSLPVVCRFFDLRDDEIVQPKRRLDYGRSLARNENSSPRYLLGFYLCIGMDLAQLVALPIMPYLPWLVLSGAALILPAILSLRHPEWYSLTMFGIDSKFLYGKRLLPAWLLLFPPLFLLMLRLPDVTYLSDARLVLIGMLPAAFLSLIIWLLSPERKVSGWLLAVVLLAWTGFGISAGAAVNAVPYYNAAPDRTEICRITALEQYREADCYVMTEGPEGELKLHVSPDYFDRLTVGDAVTVDFYDGALSIPFACVSES